MSFIVCVVRSESFLLVDHLVDFENRKTCVDYPAGEDGSCKE